MLAWAIGWQELVVAGAIVFALLVIPAWVFGGGALLFVGGRFIARAPKATYWRSVGAHALSGVCSVLICGLAAGLCAGLCGPSGVSVGLLVGGVGSLFVVWAIIKAMFGTSFGRAILAWVPTLAEGITVVPILAAVLVPSLQRATELTNRTVCMSNLSNIGKGITLYKLSYDNRYPPDLDALIAEGHPAKLFRCPSADPLQRPAGRKYDYFYLPPRSDNYPDQIVVCDFRDNHRGKHRNVLCVAMNVARMTEADFQAELEKPVNADFAKALREAEGP